MTAHQAKKLDIEALRAFRDRFALPLSDEQVERLDFYRPSDNSAELVYLRAAPAGARRLSAGAPALGARGRRAAARQLCGIRASAPRARRCRRPWPPSACSAIF